MKSSEIRKLIRRYEKGGKLVAEALRDVPLEVLDRKPAPGKWSIRQLAAHLADAEVVGVARLRTTAAQPGSALKAYDQDAWADRLGYEQQAPEQMAKLFRLLRKTTGVMLRSLPEAAWENKAVHEERGEMSLADFVKLYAEHAEHHAGQIRALREQFGAAPAA